MILNLKIIFENFRTLNVKIFELYNNLLLILISIIFFIFEQIFEFTN